MRFAIYGGIAFTSALYWVHVPLVGYFCSPRNGGWVITNMMKCKNLTVWGPVQGFCALILDVYIFIIPFPVVNQLHLEQKKKVGVLFLFGTAIFGIVASTLAEVYRFKLYFDASDSNWRQSQVFICV